MEVGESVDEAAVADAATDESSLDEAIGDTLLASDVAAAVGHAVDGPYWTIR